MNDEKLIIEYLRRSYFAADGLWFVKLEEQHSYEEALKIDELVWQVLPKIQARKARQLLGIKGGSLSDLYNGLKLKFEAEEYEHTAEDDGKTLCVNITTCPWFELMKKSGRTSKAEEVCDLICALDFKVWASEFSENIEFKLGEKLAAGDSQCELRFTLAGFCGTVEKDRAAG